MILDANVISLPSKFCKGLIILERVTVLLLWCCGKLSFLFLVTLHQLQFSKVGFPTFCFPTDRKPSVTWAECHLSEMGASPVVRGKQICIVHDVGRREAE